MGQWAALAIFILLNAALTQAGLCPVLNGANPLQIKRACNNVSYSCALTASPPGAGESCNTLCASFGATCDQAYNVQECGNRSEPLLCSSAANDILCYCTVNQTGGICPPPAPSQVAQCLNTDSSCVVASQPPSPVTCNSICQAMSPPAYCVGAWATSDCYDRASSIRCSQQRSGVSNITCQCDAYLPPDPFVTFSSRGSSSACRALNSDDANKDGCKGLLGCYYTAIEDGSIRSLADCQDRCRADPECLGIEYGSSGRRCELWHVPFPYIHNASGYECLDKIDNRLCLEQPVPYPLKLLDAVPCFPLNWGGSCKVTCATGFVPQEVDMRCDKGTVTFPTNVCIKKEFGDSADSVVVSFALVYDLNATCVALLDDTEGNMDTIAVAACVGFAYNVMQALALGPDNPTVTQVTLIPEGALCSLMFASSPGTNASAIVNEFLALKYANISSLTSFNISTVNGICEVSTDILKLTISFGSLFAYVTGLAQWVLFLMCGLLLLATLMFLYINRKSDHPLALLGAFLSLFSLGGKIVFIAFLNDTYEQLRAYDLRQTEFFKMALTIAVAVLVFSFVFNFICTTLLFRRHALKNYDAFAAWVTKHRCGVAVVLLLCGLNPASFLILCSGSFGKDVFKAPVSMRAQNQFQGAGLLSVFIGDGPPICLHVLTLLLVSDDSVLQWRGGTNSILFPLIFSSAAIAVGILRRSILICVAPIVLKTKVDQTAAREEEASEELSSQPPASAAHVQETSSMSVTFDEVIKAEPPTPPHLRMDLPTTSSRPSTPSSRSPEAPPVFVEESVASSLAATSSKAPVEASLLAELSQSVSRMPARSADLSNLRNAERSFEFPQPSHSVSLSLSSHEEGSCPSSHAMQFPRPGRSLVGSGTDPVSPAMSSMRLPPPGRPIGT